MKKIIYTILLSLICLQAFGQWNNLPAGTWQRTADGFKYRTAFGASGTAFWYTKSQIDSLVSLKQNTVTLTTSGSGGASTFNPATGALNIPNYSSGGLVNSFNGRSGAVVPLVSDYSAFYNPLLGFTPENVANKATTFGTLNNTLYPTTQAVANYITSVLPTNYIINGSSLQTGASFNINSGILTSTVSGTSPFLTLINTNVSVAQSWQLFGANSTSSGWGVKNVTSGKVFTYQTTDGEFRIGSQTNIPANGSRLYIFGGVNGANVDSQGDGTISDQATFEAEGSDYNTNPGNSIAIRYFGVNNIFGTTLGFANTNLGHLDFGSAATSIISSGSTTPIIVGVNNAEVARFTTSGFQATSLKSTGFGGSKALVSSGTTIAESSVTSTELGYSSGVTSLIQTQLNTKLTGNAVSGSCTNCNLTYVNGQITIAANGSAGGTGTVTSIIAGTGLSGGTITTSGTIAVNTSQNITTLSNLTTAGFVQTTSAGLLSSALLTSGQVTTALTYTPVNPSALLNLTATDATLTFSGSYNTTVARTVGLNLANANIWTAVPTVNIANITTTSTDGLVIANNTASVSGTTLQNSPRLRFTGSVWNTTSVAAANQFDWKQEARGVSGTTPTSSLFWSSSLVTGTTPSFTDQLQLTSAGQLIAPLGSNTNPTYSFAGNTGTGMYSSVGSGRLDFAIAGTDLFRFDNAGNFYILSNNGGNNGGFILGTSSDLTISRIAANEMQIGITQSSTVANSFHGANSSLVSNSAGGNLKIGGGTGTGTAAAGNTIIEYAAPGSSGSALNTRSTAVSINGGTGQVTINNFATGTAGTSAVLVNSGSGVVGSIAASSFAYTGLANTFTGSLNTFSNNVSFTGSNFGIGSRGSVNGGVLYGDGANNMAQASSLAYNSGSGGTLKIGDNTTNGYVFSANNTSNLPAQLPFMTTTQRTGYIPSGTTSGGITYDTNIDRFFQLNNGGVWKKMLTSDDYASLIIGTPTIVAGTGAGTSPTVSVTSNGRSLQVTVITGTLPTGTNATVGTVTLANALTYTPYPVFSSGNASTSLLSGASMIYMTSTGSANVTITSGTTALTAATTYIWNISL